MDIKELEGIMIKYGVALRAIPRVVRSIYEKQHINRFPDARIEYFDAYKSEMLVVETFPEMGGKFIFEYEQNTTRMVSFTGVNYYDSIEEAINGLLEDVKKFK